MGPGADRKRTGSAEAVRRKARLWARSFPLTAANFLDCNESYCTSGSIVPSAPPAPARNIRIAVKPDCVRRSDPAEKPGFGWIQPDRPAQLLCFQQNLGQSRLDLAEPPSDGRAGERFGGNSDSAWIHATRSLNSLACNKISASPAWIHAGTPRNWFRWGRHSACRQALLAAR